MNHIINKVEYKNRICIRNRHVCNGSWWGVGRVAGSERQDPAAHSGFMRHSSKIQCESALFYCSCVEYFDFVSSFFSVSV